MAGKGRGYFGHSREHGLHRKGISTKIDEHRRFDVSKFVARGNNSRDFHLGGNNWGMKYNPDGKVNHVFELSLGNLSTAGWYWDGSEADLILFLSRLNQNDEVRAEFLKQIQETDLKPKDIEDYLHDSIVDEDSLYALSGDNLQWRFADDPTIDFEAELDEMQRKYDLTDEQKEKLEENFFATLGGINYSEFNDEYGDNLRKELQKQVLRSDSFEDILEELKEIQETARENTHEFISNQEFEALSKAEHEFVKEFNLKASGLSKKHELQRKAIQSSQDHIESPPLWASEREWKKYRKKLKKEKPETYKSIYGVE